MEDPLGCFTIKDLLVARHVESVQ